MTKFNFGELIKNKPGVGSETPTGDKNKAALATEPAGKNKMEKKPITDDKLKTFSINSFLIDLATSSEFERILYKALFGKVIRGSNEVAEQKLEEGIQEFRKFITNK